MEVWAYEFCYCEHETGYTVQSLHKTKDGAEKEMNSVAEKERQKGGSGQCVTAWEVK